MRVITCDNLPKKHRPYTTFLVSVAALSGFIFGFDTAVISGALSPLIGYFGLASKPMQQGWLVSSVVSGSIVGSLFSGYCSDKFGRKYMLVCAGLFFLISSIGVVFSENFETFILFRLIAGFAVGIAAMVSPLYIAEIAPVSLRGRMVAVNQFALTLGILVAYFVNEWIAQAPLQRWKFLMVFDQEEIWRVMLGSAAIPSVLFLMLLGLVPESPTFWMLKGNEKEAFRVLTQLNGPEVARREMSNIRKILSTQTLNLTAVFHPRYRSKAFIVLFLAIVSQLSGIDLVLHYGPVILERAGFSFSESLGGQMFFGAVLVGFTLLALWKVDTLGRKPLLFAGNAGIFGSLLCIGFFFTHQNFNASGLLISISCFVAFFAFSMGPIPWIIMSEIFPAEIRGQAMAIGTCALFFANWVIAQLFPVSLEYFGESVTFWVLAALTLPTFLIVWKFLPETKGKVLETDIIESFEN